MDLYSLRWCPTSTPSSKLKVEITMLTSCCRTLLPRQMWKGTRTRSLPSKSCWLQEKNLWINFEGSEEGVIRRLLQGSISSLCKPRTWPTRDQLLKMFREAARKHQLSFGKIWVVVKIMVPFFGTLNIRCRTILGIQKGTLILTIPRL